MLFTIWSIKLFLSIILDYKKLKFKHLSNDIIINIFFFFGKFCKYKGYKKKMQFNTEFFKIHI